MLVRERHSLVSMNIFVLLLGILSVPHCCAGIRKALLPYLSTECLRFLEYFASTRTFRQPDYASVARAHPQ